MKELFSAFSAAVFYPLVSLVMPGLAAISGWFVLLVAKPGFRCLVDRNHTETALMLMLLSIFVGTVIDDMGKVGERMVGPEAKRPDQRRSPGRMVGIFEKTI
jgi:hypothetical protein